MNRMLKIILFVVCGLFVLATTLLPALGVFHLNGWVAFLYIMGVPMVTLGLLGVAFQWTPPWRAWVLVGVGLALVILSILGSNVWGWGMTNDTVDVKNETIIEPTVITETKVTPEPPQTTEHGSGNPQNYVPHPNFYVETTVSSKETWVITVNEGEVGIIGGWSVNGKTGGTYIGLGPGTYTISVVDGFALTVEERWAQAEWNFRIGQAIQYGWSHENLDPGPITP